MAGGRAGRVRGVLTHQSSGEGAPPPKITFVLNQDVILLCFETLRFNIIDNCDFSQIAPKAINHEDFKAVFGVND